MADQITTTINKNHYIMEDDTDIIKILNNINFNNMKFPS